MFVCSSRILSTLIHVSGHSDLQHVPKLVSMVTTRSADKRGPPSTGDELVLRSRTVHHADSGASTPVRSRKRGFANGLQQSDTNGKRARVDDKGIQDEASANVEGVANQHSSQVDRSQQVCTPSALTSQDTTPSTERWKVQLVDTGLSEGTTPMDSTSHHFECPLLEESNKRSDDSAMDKEYHAADDRHGASVRAADLLDRRTPSARSSRRSTRDSVRKENSTTNDFNAFSATLAEPRSEDALLSFPAQSSTTDTRTIKPTGHAQNWHPERHMVGTQQSEVLLHESRRSGPVDEANRQEEMETARLVDLIAAADEHDTAGVSKKVVFAEPALQAPQLLASVSSLPAKVDKIPSSETRQRSSSRLPPKPGNSFARFCTERMKRHLGLQTSSPKKRTTFVVS